MDELFNVKRKEIITLLFKCNDEMFMACHIRYLIKCNNEQFTT